MTKNANKNYDIYLLGNFNPFSGMSSKITGIHLKKHFFQKSILCDTCNTVQLPYEKNILEHEWALNQVYDDFSKNYIEEILYSPADYLLIDALGSVVPVKEICYQGKCVQVTYSDSMAKVCTALESKKLISITSKNCQFSEEDLQNRISLFCKSISAVYPQNKIIIHQATYAQYYEYNSVAVSVDNDTIQQREKNTILLNKIYSYIKQYLPNAHYIEMPSDICTKSKNSPFVYSDEYSKYLVAQILLAINPRYAAEFLKNIYSFFLFTRNSKTPENITLTANIDELISTYEYKLECYNRKFREYEEIFLNTYNSIMGTNYQFLPFKHDELSYGEFIKLKSKSAPIKTKTNSKFYLFCIYPWTRLKEFRAYQKKYGLRAALKKAKSKIDELNR